ncbi:phycobilisome linker polypeptide [Synechococcus sp. PCC 7336]|uniref:phycobilisome linker polypeptide n=1 Tax=Synechococcus sp. PCC 7336 TaxID=195250 RepID=UPI00057100E4|nr:phycobilisome linker polypeptide [Synechococcus sp. PCC 7336]
MRMFKITACFPTTTNIRTQRELQNTYVTKCVNYDNWFAEQQRIQKAGGKILKVELTTGSKGVNVGIS